MKVLIPFDEAREIELENAKLLPWEKVSLLEAPGRVVAEDIVSDITLPPWDNSGVDGYAIRGDYREGDKRKIVEIVAAGDYSDVEVTETTAVKIMTGAPVPPGADRVIMVEDTEVEGDYVVLKRVIPEGKNIRRRGEDIREGEVVVERGKVLRPYEIGEIASVGRSHIKVFRRATVGILATGNEIVDIDERRNEFQIRNSNGYTLYSQVKEAGAIPFMLGIAGDSEEELEERVKAGLQFDILVTSGAISMGDYDLLKKVLQKLDVEIHFWKVRERPGLPLLFATAGETLIFCLPGNPVSTAVMFEQHVRPVLLKMMGHKRIFRPRIKARIDTDLKLKKGLRHFVRVKLTEKDGEWWASLTGNQGSGILSSMVKADGLLVYYEDEEYKRGDYVDVEIINEKIFYREEA